MQILDEYEGVKKFKLNPNDKDEGKEEEGGGKQGEGMLAKSTTAKLLEELETTSKARRHVPSNILLQCSLDQSGDAISWKPQ